MNFTFLHFIILISSIYSAYGTSINHGNEIIFKTHSDTGWVPPDSAFAVGNSRIVSAVNGAISIFDKQTRTLLSSLTLSTFIQGERGAPFDPRLTWDYHGRRFIGAVTCGTNSGTSNITLFISKTDSPNILSSNDWYQYIFDKVNPNQWADYPTLGVDKYNIYFSVNMFGDGNNPVLSPTYPYWIIKKSSVYNGALEFSFKQFLSPRFTVHPAVNFDNGEINKQYLVNIGTSNSLRIFELSNVNATNMNDILLSELLINTPFTLPGGLTNAQQKDGILVETNDLRLQNAFVINNKLYTTSTFSNSLTSTTNVAWFEIDIILKKITNYGRIGNGDPTTWYFFPTIVSDKFGNIAIIYSISNSTIYPSLAYSVYNSTSGIYVVNNRVAVMGTKPYTKSRYGDYSAISLDPDDRVRVWAASQVSSGLSGAWEMYGISFCPGCFDSRLNNNVCTGVLCNGHGVCNIGNGLCDCQNNWSGNNCDICSVGYYGTSCIDCPLCVHGFCNDGLSGNGTCTCDAGYSGMMCNIQINNNICAGITCNDHGNCSQALNGTCVCNSGYSGAMCEIELPVVCQHGMKATKENKCICACGYTGRECTSCASGYFSEKCVSCAINCINGICVQNGTTNMCSCSSGWTGITCGELIGGGNLCDAPLGYCCTNAECPGSYCKNYQAPHPNGYWICQ